MIGATWAFYYQLGHIQTNSPEKSRRIDGKLTKSTRHLKRGNEVHWNTERGHASLTFIEECTLRVSFGSDVYWPSYSELVTSSLPTSESEKILDSEAGLPSVALMVVYQLSTNVSAAQSSWSWPYSDQREFEWCISSLVKSWAILLKQPGTPLMVA